MAQVAAAAGGAGEGEGGVQEPLTPPSRPMPQSLRAMRSIVLPHTFSRLPEEARARLTQVSEELEHHSRAVHGAAQAPPPLSVSALHFVLSSAPRRWLAAARRARVACMCPAKPIPGVCPCVQSSLRGVTREVTDCIGLLVAVGVDPNTPCDAPRLRGATPLISLLCSWPVA